MEQLEEKEIWTEHKDMSVLHVWPSTGPWICGYKENTQKSQAAGGWSMITNTGVFFCLGLKNVACPRHSPQKYSCCQFVYDVFRRYLLTIGISQAQLYTAWACQRKLVDLQLICCVSQIVWVKEGSLTPRNALTFSAKDILHVSTSSNGMERVRTVEASRNRAVVLRRCSHALALWPQNNNNSPHSSLLHLFLWLNMRLHAAKPAIVRIGPAPQVSFHFLACHWHVFRLTPTKHKHTANKFPPRECKCDFCWHVFPLNNPMLFRKSQ